MNNYRFTNFWCLQGCLFFKLDFLINYRQLNNLNAFISGPPPPPNIRVISSTTITLLLEWNDECEDNPAAKCDNDRTTSEYVITYHVADGGTAAKRQIPGSASQYNLTGIYANNNYEITMMIVANGSNIFSDRSPVVFGTTSEFFASKKILVY